MYPILNSVYFSLHCLSDVSCKKTSSEKLSTRNLWSAMIRIAYYSCWLYVGGWCFLGSVTYSKCSCSTYSFWGLQYVRTPSGECLRHNSSHSFWGSFLTNKKNVTNRYKNTWHFSRIVTIVRHESSCDNLMKKKMEKINKTHVRIRDKKTYLVYTYQVLFLLTTRENANLRM